MLLLLGRLSIIRHFLLYDFFNLSYFNKTLKHFDIFVGMSYLQRLDSKGLLFSLFYFLQNLNLIYSNLHIISLKMGRLNSFEFNLVNFNINSSLITVSRKLIKFFYLCGID
jgi:hypothetical protein